MSPCAARRCLIVGVVLAAGVGLGAAPADAAKTLIGYTFCGYKDFGGSGWTDTVPQGAFLVLYSKRMSCRTAHKKYRRVNHSSLPPTLPGFTCRKLDEAYEFLDAQCRDRDQSGRLIRWLTGS
jgi:spermidine/putrescine-binding protein